MANSLLILLLLTGLTANSQTNTFPASGPVGIGTATPQSGIELHLLSGDTPTIRFEQDNSNGWDPYTWDIAGNEVNFFIRDEATANLPFRIRPGAPDNSIYVEGNGYLGIGHTNPQQTLDVDGAIKIRSTNDTVPGTIRWTGTDFEGADTSNQWVSLTKDEALQQQVDDLSDTVDSLMTVITNCCMAGKVGEPNMPSGTLYQNEPNPFDQNTEIGYYLPQDVQQAVLHIYNLEGKHLEEINLTNRGETSVSIGGSRLGPGMYLYTLIADGEVVGTKRMVLTD